MSLQSIKISSSLPSKSSAQPILLIGEALHGVHEFWQYKLDLIKQHFEQGKRFAVGFEADELGIASLLDSQNVDELLLAFPHIFRTHEVANILAFCLSNTIPIFGFDNRIRVPENKITPELSAQAKIYTQIYRTYFGTSEYFAIRDLLMAQAIERYLDQHNIQLLCLTHNLHIRKNGSQELQNTIKLKSMREHLDESGIKSKSLALIAHQGEYLNIDLTPAHFAITDPDSAEALSIPDKITSIYPLDNQAKKHCYLLGTIKESTPAKESYDHVVLFHQVQKPHILSPKS